MAEVEAAETADVMGYLQSNSDEILEQVNEYSYLVGDALALILVGVLSVLLLHKLASRFIYRFIANQRLIRVIFGTLYILVFVVTGIAVLRKVGFEVGTGGSIAILLVLFLAVLVYFIIPFMPRLPFMPGHMIETYGVLGTVEAVTSFHTTIRKFDGTLVFLPNAMVLASKILNFSYTPNRRIELNLSVTTDSDLDRVKERLLAVAAGNQKVLGDPAPSVFAMHADASGIQVTLYCWVANADFLGTRSDLWQQTLQLAKGDSNLALALPRQEVTLREQH
jgi:small conductance mechanosensitive channel